MDAEIDLEIRLLLEAIYDRYHYDFRSYAKASLKRRLAQACDHLKVTSLSGLQERVLHEPEVFAGLLQYLTVQVSDMFRDPGFFRAIRTEVLPVLATYPSIKVWVAGCSTGEEAYSFAIMLREEGLLERTLIYATDINAETLEKAQAGIYEVDRIAGFTENHRQSGGTTSLSATTPRRTAARSSIRPSSRISSSPTTAWRPTVCSPRCRWSRAATS